MPCYHPIQAWLPVGGSASKKVLFKESNESGREINLPCGQCIGCRLEYSRQWAVRIVHESKMYNHNCFITLTFDDEHLPFNESLDVKYFQDFMKRFRKKVKSKWFINKFGFYCKKLRYFHCGEYGEKRGRPHYHACIFNFDFPDRKYHSCRKGVKLYTSEVLSDLWPCGFSSVGDVTFESAAYVARYVCKKVNGKLKNEHYQHLGIECDKDTGECIAKIPEYTTMSRRPGIGNEFFKQYGNGIYPQDMIVIRDGIKCKPPKYYDNLYEMDNLENLEIIKRRREDRARLNLSDNTKDRLAVKEKVQIAKSALYSKRVLE